MKWFQRSDKQTSTAVLSKGRINVSDPDIKRQMEMTGFTGEMLGVLSAFRPSVEERIGELVDFFYANLEIKPHLMEIIETNSSVEKLKQTLRKHISEMFTDTIDDGFVEKRIRIAKVHVRIGLEPKWYLSAYQALQVKLFSLVYEVYEPGEAETVIKAVSSIVSFEQQLVLEAFEDELQAVRRQEEELRQQLDVYITGKSEELGAISQQTNASMEEMKLQAEGITSNSRTGTVISSASKESALEGSTRLKELQRIMQETTGSIEQIDTKMQELASFSKEIQNIVGIVQGIADETNLLALNAAIEAARAGEHGRGFAIVADEVRKLSEQTKESVGKVRGLTNQTDKGVQENAALSKEIAERMAQGNQSAEAVAETFAVILRKMEEAVSKNTEIESELTAFMDVIGEVNKASGQVAITAEELLDHSRDLKNGQ
ncbi:protoglobin domain-containing protein [Alkalicoccus luteus]|uniref:Globin-coupled sensor protein n=1 Tax=Alkalicoccus luteus TaxID=1237094 RepID=A0A969PUB2_9BACI|nr:globin-coupled sensor protein [Alkalicoccus luteus]NJP38536.1 globin-coupled sensor protein [Alkalicoccus luteus]